MRRKETSRSHLNLGAGWSFSPSLSLSFLLFPSLSASFSRLSFLSYSFRVSFSLAFYFLARLPLCAFSGTVQIASHSLLGTVRAELTTREAAQYISEIIRLLGSCAFTLIHLLAVCLVTASLHTGTTGPFAASCFETNNCRLNLPCLTCIIFILFFGISTNRNSFLHASEQFLEISRTVFSLHDFTYTHFLIYAI